jgi:hypothetical protein
VSFASYFDAYSHRASMHTHIVLQCILTSCGNAYFHRASMCVLLAFCNGCHVARAHNTLKIAGTLCKLERE